jgi:hypothetical protein
MQDDSNKCKICGFYSKSNNGLGSHIKQAHGIEIKKYYDFYILCGIIPKCKQCENEPSFFNLVNGYREHCSKSCSKKIQPNSVGWTHSKKDDYVPWNKGKKMSEEYRNNWLNSIKNTNWGSAIPWNKGKSMSEEHRIKLADSLKNTRFGKSPDAETRKKLRKSIVDRLEKINKKFHPPYNKKGCEYFNKLMIETGTNIQHAENGGEFHIKELGYWVDGYDKENNIVYEWDEKSHYINGKLKEKDISRQREIENFLNCLFIRIKEESD